TGIAAFDGVGSILIGVLLAVVAVLLIQRNHRFLVGMAPPDSVRQEVLRQVLLHAAISRITFLHLEFVGPAACCSSPPSTSSTTRRSRSWRCACGRCPTTSSARSTSRSQIGRASGGESVNIKANAVRVTIHYCTL